MPNFLAISLGKFKPSRFHELTIASELQEWLAAKDIVKAGCMLSKNRLPIQVRNPSDHIRISTTDKIVTQWHRDGLGSYALDEVKEPALKWMILWSNGTPTELRDCNKNLITFLSYDVVLVDNRSVWHRCPPNEDGRWFVRLLEPFLPMSMA